MKYVKHNVDYYPGAAFAGCTPVWPYSRRWGYSGSGLLGILLVVLLLALILGWI
jgi:hypothetical protein